MVVTNGTATNNTDFTYNAGFTIPAGNYSTLQTLTLNNINIIGNTIYCQGNRTFTVSIPVQTCNDLLIQGSINSAVVTIIEDDTAVVNQPSNFNNLCPNIVFPSVVFSGNTAPGGSYRWTNNNTNIGLVSSGTGNLPQFTTTNSTISPLTSTIRVCPTVGGRDCQFKDFTITVNPTPTIDTATATICSSGTFTVTPTNGVGGDIVPTGTTYTWVVSTPNANITGATAQSTPQTSISQTLTNTSASPQSVVYTVTATYGTCTSTFLITVTVNNYPTLTGIEGDKVVCINNSIQLTNATSGGVWTINNANATLSNHSSSPASVTVTGVTEGTTYITYTLSNGFCETKKTFLLKILPANSPELKIGFEK
jgi:hypothetical protein